MKLCPACSRHLRADATTCPFCHVTWGASASPLAALSLAAGLLLAGCGGETKAPAVAAPSGPAADPSPSPAPDSTPAPVRVNPPVPVEPPDNAPIAAYGGPPSPSTSLSPPPDPPKRAP